MHEIEPYYKWRDDYIAAEDEYSPFYATQYNEFEFDKQIYNYLLHPQWDSFGSNTLYMKVLFVDYERSYAIIEFIGEWNDAINNDIMLMKREIIELMIDNGINQFILIGENVLNFHSSDTEYYMEWTEEIADNSGWIAAVNMPEATTFDFLRSHIDRYVSLIDAPNWRTYRPTDFFNFIDNKIFRSKS